MVRSGKLGLIVGAIVAMIWGICSSGDKGGDLRGAVSGDKVPLTLVISDSADSNQSPELRGGDREGLGAALIEARHAILPIDARAAALPENADVHFFAYNPAQDLAARFGGSAVSIGDGFDNVTLSRIDSDAGTHTNAVVSGEGNRVEYRHPDGVVEWWENQTAGLQQGFVVPEGAVHDATVKICVATEGMSVDADPTSPGNLRFCEVGDGEPRFGYRDLKAWDAQGIELAASMYPVGGGLEISVSTVGAAFPIVIDPVVVKLQGILRPQALGPVGPTALYGDSLAIEGDLAVVGAPADKDNFGPRGAVYVFRKSNGIWKFEARLRAPIKKGVGFPSMGVHVAIANGQILASAPGRFDDPTQAGFVQTFAYARGRWKPAQKIKSPDGASGFGFATNFTVSGNTLAVAALGELNGRLYYFSRKGTKWIPSTKLEAPKAFTELAMEDDVTAIGVTGGVWIYRRKSTGWSQEFASEESPGRFISKLAVSGGRVFFGAPYETNVGTGFRTGTVFICNYEQSSQTWNMSRLEAPNPTTSQTFGSSIAVAGNRLLVANSENIHNYRLDPVPVEGPPISKPDAYYAVGGTLAVSGNRMIINGLLNHRSGHRGTGIESYDLDGETWRPAGRLNPGYNGENGMAAVGNGFGGGFGGGLAITGERAFFGAPGDANPESLNSGCVYVFRRVKKAWKLEARLTAPQPRMDASFGRALAALPGRLVVGSSELHPVSQSGVCAHVFTNAGMEWRHEEALALSTPGLPLLSDMTIATQGDRILVGLPWYTLSGKDGNAVLYSKEAGRWQLEKTFLGNGVSTATSVALGPDAVWIAAYDFRGSKVYGHAKEDGVWTLKTTLTPLVEDASPNGAPVLALSGDHLFVSQWADNDTLLEIYPTNGTVAGVPERLRSTAEHRFAGDPRVAASGDIFAIITEVREGQSKQGIQFIQRGANGWSMDKHVDLGENYIPGLALHGDTLLAMDPEGVNEAFPNENVMQGNVRYFTISSPQPDIVVKLKKKNIARGGTLNFKGESISLTLQNKGKAMLADIDVRVDGADAGDFLLSSLPTRNLAPGESMELVIQVSATASSRKMAKLMVLSNDSDKNPYPIQLRYARER